MDPIVAIAVLALAGCVVIFARQAWGQRCRYCGKWLRQAPRYCPRCRNELG